MSRLKNNEIKAMNVIVIDKEGKKTGERPLAEAIALAQSDNLDLIQMNDDEVPICKIISYSKMLYEEKRKTKSHGKSDSSSKMKEVKFKTAIGEHDLQTKISHINSFLEKGNRVQITIQLNRHQKERADVAKEFLDQILSNLSQKYSLQSNPAMREYSYGVTLMSGVKKGK